MQRHLPNIISTLGASLLAVIAGLLISAAVNRAHSAEHERAGPYGALGGEWTHVGAFDTDVLTDDQFPDSWGVNAAAGFRWRSGLMVEMLGEYRKYEGEAAAETFSLLPCVLYELDTALTIDPYAGGCVGYGHVRTEYTAASEPGEYDGWEAQAAEVPVSIVDEDGGGWEWRLRGGLAFQLTEDGAWRVRTEYSYGCIEGLHLASAGEGDLCAHNAGANLVVGF